MISISDVREWAERRLREHREKLEIQSCEQLTIERRARIAEIKELLDALRNETPPVWITPAE